MNTSKPYFVVRSLNQRLLLTVFAVFCALFVAQDVWAQVYETTLRQRRRGDEIHVEVWLKSLSASAPNLGDATLVVQYNTTFLTPALTQYPSVGDSVQYDVDAVSPIASLTSPFHNANGYSNITTASYGSGYYGLDIKLSSLGSGGYKPATTGRGTFVGKLIFTLQGSPVTTSTTDIQWSSAITPPGVTQIFDVNGNNIKSTTTFTNPSAFTVVGITLLNPNGPSEVVDRDKTYLSVNSTSGTTGYPIYFERSALNLNNMSAATNATAYIFEYSLDGGSSWSEFGRVAETTVDANTLAAAGTLTNHISGAIATNATMVATNANVYIIGTQDGLPITSATYAYRNPLRVVWATDASFSARSENAKIRITQLDLTGYGSIITGRTKLTTLDLSDASFVLGRLFFLQLDGATQYLKTSNNFSNPTFLTVETWINLNEYKATGATVGIVASSGGPTAGGEEGAWMLYLKDGRYPAFRAREILGRGIGGYVGTVVSPDALEVVSDVAPLSSSHPGNWMHLAATVANDTVSLYVNGIMVDRSLNDSATDVRMMTTNHPVWVGVNPNAATLATDSYLHAGIKGTRVWRAALRGQEIHQRIAGISGISNTSGTTNVLKTLELAYTFEGTRNDAANEFFFQNRGDTIQYYLNGAISNASTRFRADQPHLRLTSPVGGEGISNLPDSAFAVTWVGYGIGTVASLSTPTADMRIEFSSNGGTTWVTAAGVATELTNVDLESGAIAWHPQSTIATSSLRTFSDSSYSKSVQLRLKGAYGGDTNIVATSRTFTVAPYFAAKRSANSIITVDDGGLNNAWNITGTDAYMEAWIRPYRFPTTGESYFPIISKNDTTSGNIYYSFRLLSTGQLQFVLRDANGTLRTATSTSSADSLVVKPNTVSLDSAWTHVGVYVGLGSGGRSDTRFYIDGVPQTASTTATGQLGSSLTVDVLNAYQSFIGYEKVTTGSKGFIGEMREVRFWNGAPNDASATGSEPTGMTSYIQGAQAIRGGEITSSYNANLVSSVSFNGHGFINPIDAGTAFLHRSLPTSNTNVRARFYGDSITFVAARPYIKLVEPSFRQRVKNNVTNLKVRWVGFDYGTATTGTIGGSALTSTFPANQVKAPSIEYSIRGGGGLLIQPYQYVAGDYWSISGTTATQSNSISFPTTSSYRLTYSGNAPIQFAAQLNISAADPDPDDDGTMTTGTTKIAAALTNVRLRATTYLSTTGSLGISTTSTIHAVSSEGGLFTIVPPSNFTVRVLLEGYHNYTNNTFTNLGSTYDNGGLKIRLYKDNSGTPGAIVDSAESSDQYQNSAFTRSDLNAGGNNFANVPFIFTNLPDGNYWVVVDHRNHLPVMSKYPAPFNFSGDNSATYDIESGWDFSTWGGGYNNVYTTTGTVTTFPSSTLQSTSGTGVYTAYYSSLYLPTNVTEATTYPVAYNRTGLIFNRGVEGNTLPITSGTAIASMVAGDVNKDGEINAADRVQVSNDAGTSLGRSDVTGDGSVNGTDRTIVYRNEGKGSSISGVISGTTQGDDHELFTVQAPAGNGDNAEPIVMAGKEAYEILASGLNYTVTAEPKLNGKYLEVPVYIQNTGGAFSMANATYAVQFNTNVLRYVSLDNTGTVIFNNKPGKGYADEYSAPKPNVDNALPNVRSIEIVYTNFDKPLKSGEVVPTTKTFLGTLRFEVKTDDPIILKWYRSSVVHSINGQNVTAFGKFEDIKPILQYSASVVYPNGGEQLRANKGIAIRWAHDKAKTIRVEYSINNGASWMSAIPSVVNASILSTQWVTPNIRATQCLVRIVDEQSGLELDRSDAPFSIAPATAAITKPAALDAPYSGGKTDYVKWITEGYSKVRFEFTANGVNATDWKSISAERNASDASLMWTLPAVTTKRAVVRMIDTETGEVAAMSGEFKILAGNITLLNPKANEELPVGETRRVRWTVENVNFFDMQFSIDGGATWITNLMTNGDASKRYIDWVVPNQPTNQAILRAIVPGDPELVYNTTAPFRITSIVGVDPTEYTGYVLAEPQPNPIKNESLVQFAIPQEMAVTITLHTLMGEEVLRLADAQRFQSGVQSVQLKSDGLASGVYYVKMQAGTFTATKQVVIVK